MLRSSLPLFAGVVLLASGCASQGSRPPAEVYIGGGHFAGSTRASAFVERMQQKHGFSRRETSAILAQAQHQQSIINLMDRQAPRRRSTGPNGAWTRYRAKFLGAESIANGVRFWRTNARALRLASSRYGVPPEYIVAIIGVETRYGGFVGKTRILDALATLAFDYPRRADYFSGELENYLVMARQEGLDPALPRGSFAGAMGLCQFMPSSFLKYAVDLDGDGHRDLWNPADAIGSVARYFSAHGWQSGEPVAVPARVQSRATAAGLEFGYDTRYSLQRLARQGISPSAGTGRAGSASLLRLDAQGGYEYWLGLKNFYVITRYNHSAYYAMAVHQLARAIRARHG